jgi:hypothetical protein
VFLDELENESSILAQYCCGVFWAKVDGSFWVNWIETLCGSNYVAGMAFGLNG